MKRQTENVNIPQVIGIKIALDRHAKVAGPSYRVPHISQNRFVINFSTASPANATVGRVYSLSVPRDCDHDDNLILAREDLMSDSVEARITELLPQTSPALQMRLNIAAQRIVSEALRDLEAAASKVLRGSKA
jgi:hypothetical protein